MSVKINNQEVHGVIGYLIAVPILVLTFAWLALTFLALALIALSPLLLVGVIVWLATH